MNLPSLSFQPQVPLGFYAGPKGKPSTCNQLAVVESQLAAAKKARKGLFGADGLLGLGILRTGAEAKAREDQVEFLKGEKARLKELCKAGVNEKGVTEKGGKGKGKGAKDGGSSSTATLDPTLDPSLAVESDTSSSAVYLVGGIAVLGVLGVVMAMALGGKKSAPAPASRFGT